MKLIHLSDLHLGKRVNEFSMLDDQQYILTQILDIADEQKPNGIIIAGDIYDKSVPSAEAVELFDRFVNVVNARGYELFAISGNHDSPERIGFGASVMDKSGVHFSPAYDGKAKVITLTDKYGECAIYLLPFVKPANVRKFFDNSEISTYTDAVKCTVDQMNINTDIRNILVTHQFVTGSVRCDSEDASVGGCDNVDADVFKAFDYVALGHIHGPQNAGKNTVRYCGSPLKYSFSEANHQKSVTVIELAEKGNIQTYTVPLKPIHDMREIKGSYMEITAKSYYDGTKTDDYLHITLTDEEDIPDAIAKLRIIYPNIMRLDYDNKRTRASALPLQSTDSKDKSPVEMFEIFYEEQNGKPPDELQSKLAKEIMDNIIQREI